MKSHAFIDILYKKSDFEEHNSLILLNQLIVPKIQKLSKF